MDHGSTHWEGCWRDHHQCAIKQVERLAAELAGLEDFGTVLVVHPDNIHAIPDGTRVIVQRKLPSTTQDDAALRAHEFAVRAIGGRDG